MATRLLDAPWKPTDEDLALLQRVIDSGRRAVRAILLESGVQNAVDAGLVLDSLSAAPESRFARRSALQGVLAVLDHFAASAHVLANRHAGREPFLIGDEYEVQDLFRALVLPVMPDLQPEDPAPKLAGKSVRLDFMSRAGRIGFEVKHVKSEQHAATVRKEVLLDERTYQEHPYVETVVVFIYDPGRHIALGDRAAFEADLSQNVTVGPRTVRYLARVR